jgi:hypothetical protein
MITRWNQIAICLSGALCAAILMLGGCSGGGGGASSLPEQPSQQNPANPTQAPPVQAPAPSSTTPSSTTPSNVKIYITNHVLHMVSVYDEEGHPIAGCPFSGLDLFQMVFDSNNQRLYGTHGGTVLAFDLNGNPIKTKGTFPGAGGFITFDSNNRRLYTLTGNPGQPPPPAGVVFDEDGNPVTISGTFLPNDEPFTVTADPLNHQIYVGNIAGSELNVFDEQGNGIPFPAISACDGISALAFDPHNRHFYASGPFNGTPACDRANAIVFDEAGNLLTTTGTFPNINQPFAMTFDAHNNRLYVLNISGITVYDEEGNQILTSGTFPNSRGNSGVNSIVAAPQ